jgi:hypothetical protein
MSGAPVPPVVTRTYADHADQRRRGIVGTRAFRLRTESARSEASADQPQRAASAHETAKSIIGRINTRGRLDFFGSPGAVLRLASLAQGRPPRRSDPPNGEAGNRAERLERDESGSCDPRTV